MNTAPPLPDYAVLDHAGSVVARCRSWHDALAEQDRRQAETRQPHRVTYTGPRRLAAVYP